MNIRPRLSWRATAFLCPEAKWRLTVDEAETAAKTIGGSVVVKAQIHAGGRGKGGGVKVAKNAAEARDVAEKMLGMTLVTHQTGPEGRVVQRMLIEETLPIEHEFYLGHRARPRHRQEYVSWRRPTAAWRSKRSRPRRRSGF